MNYISIRSPLFKNVTLLTFFVISFAMYGAVSLLYLLHAYSHTLLLPFYLYCVIDFFIATIVVVPILYHFAVVGKITHKATFDPLTGLYNRAAFADRINKLIKKKTKFQLLLIDLCKFKEVNDTYGHDAGDEVLRVVGKRIVESVGANDMVIRLGGDEFVILLPYANVFSHETVIQQMIEKIKEPIDINGQSLSIGLSIGKVDYPESGNDVKTLMTKADCAMYNAKKNGIDVFICHPNEGCCNFTTK